MPAAPCSIAVLISGNGTNLQALIDASENGNFRISLVISNKADAFGLERARREQIPTCVIDHRGYESRQAFDTAVQTALDEAEPRLIVLAGFMRILSAEFVQHFRGRIINIHPSLLPKYTGTNTHQRALEAGEKEHGVSVHFVTEELDGGPVIAQERVPVLPNDTAPELAARVAAREHVLYPRVVTWFAAGRLAMQDHHACLDGKILPASGAEQTNQ